jgi:peptidoglycan/LPS O-acetylase OafA/YrhL
VYLLHPVLIEAYDSVPWTRNQNFVPMELLLVAVFVLVLLVCCGLTHRFIEAPMQRLGRRVGGRLEARFGPDGVAVPADGVAVRADGVAGQADGGVMGQADGVTGQADGLAVRR